MNFATPPTQTHKIYEQANGLVQDNQAPLLHLPSYLYSLLPPISLSLSLSV